MILKWRTIFIYYYCEDKRIFSRASNVANKTVIKKYEKKLHDIKKFVWYHYINRCSRQEYNIINRESINDI